MAANTCVLADMTSRSMQQYIAPHTIGCRHHTACRKRLNTQQITEAAKQSNLPSNQHTIQPTPPTTPHENKADHMARHVTTTPPPPTVHHTIAHHTPQQTTTQHITPLYTLRDHGIVICCGRVSCGVVSSYVVRCGVVGYRAIGLPVWLVEGCVGFLAGWVVWQLGLCVGCLASWGPRCGVCTLWC